MLRLLHIENIAVIERCDITFGNGFNVLTGETGAGKSIVIDAIGAVLGSRTTRDIVRSGAQKASVSAVFEDCTGEVCEWLSENGYEDADGDNGTVLISRELSADGKNAARINGKPVTVSVLKTLGILLINILGQHDSQQLLNPDTHPIFIDRFAASAEFDKCLSEYTEIYTRLCACMAERKKLDMNEAEKARRIEMLKFQVQELQDASLTENEDTELNERHKLIQGGARLAERMHEAYNAFSGGEELSGICDYISSAARAAESVSDMSDGLKKLAEDINELYYAACDITDTLRSTIDGLDFSAEEADAVEARLDLIHKLKRKYGNSVGDMLSYLANAERELSEIEFSEEHLSKLSAEIDELHKQAQLLAERLFDMREKAARAFEEKIMRELSELDMPNARFEASLRKCERLDTRGGDTVEFLLAANLGEPPKPLEKIASGGELSRIMLAFKNVLAENDYVKTLIFDEIDTGVSGRAAQRIAEKLYKLSASKQVLCVTHLAQISAMSDVHFKIEKSEHDGRTYTNVTELDTAGRAEELARITGGSTISETTLKNALEMLQFAELAKRKRD